jgi:hypothetical protein
MGDVAESALSSPAETSRLLAVDADDVVLDCLGDVSYDELLHSLLADAQTVADERLAPASPPRGCVRRRCCCISRDSAPPPDVEAARIVVRKMAKVCFYAPLSPFLSLHFLMISPRCIVYAGQDG